LQKSPSLCFLKEVGVSACVMALALVGCGGGGGGGNDSSATANAGSNSSTTSSSSSSSRSSSSGSQVTGEAGSTALVGNDFEGIWEDNLQLPALITPDGMIYQDGDNTNLTGPITFTSNTWQLGANSTDDTPSGLNTASGSGSFTPKGQFSGSVISSNASTSKNIAVAWNYSAANGWPMPLSALAGTWQGVTIDANGNASGSIDNGGSWEQGCQITGKFQSYTPGSSKNLFKFTLTHSALPGQTCAAAASNATISGVAAVMEDSSSPLKRKLAGIANDPSTNKRTWEFYWQREK
jgi:hypothetical protein